MSETHTTDVNDSERPLADYFESLPRDAAARGTFTPDDVADIIREDRDAATA